MRFFSRHARLGAVVAVVVGLAAGGIAYASIPDSSGVIHGCYKTKKGTLRVIDSDAGATCKTSETPLNWNQTGPAFFTAYGPAVSVATGAAVSASVTCPAGMDAVAGGSVNNFGGAYANVQVNDSAPFPAIQSGSITPSNRWDTEAFNESGSTQNVRAWALCVTASLVTSGVQPAAPEVARPGG